MFNPSRKDESMKIAIAVAASLLVTAPVIAKDSAADRHNEIVCKGNRTKSLGSNMNAKKVCRTRAEWAELAADSRRDLQTMTDRRINPTPIPGAR